MAQVITDGMADGIADGMAAGVSHGPVGIGARELAQVMPMFLTVAPDGRITGAGPTLHKLLPDGALDGQAFLDVFACQRPTGIAMAADLAALPGQRIVVTLLHRSGTVLRGVAVPLQDGQGYLINLSFGIAAAAAVRDFALTGRDFAATDLTVELLYLSEANSAVRQELAALNARLQVAHEAAEERAQTDPLTGLANRRALDRAIARVVRPGGAGRPYVLLHLDLDFFKAVNDTLGHAAGDKVLCHVADVLRSETRSSDFIARVGGDEFVLLVQNAMAVPQVMALGQRIIARLEQPILYGDNECRISGSIGIVMSQDCPPPVTAEALFERADAALYASKRNGRACATLWAGGLVATTSDAGAGKGPDGDKGPDGEPDAGAASGPDMCRPTGPGADEFSAINQYDL